MFDAAFIRQMQKDLNEGLSQQGIGVLQTQMEEESMTNDFMKGMFGTLGKGMCKITMDGNIAVKTSNGYKTYDKKTGSFLNCDNFCFGGLDEMFFIVPTNAVVEGDIIFAKDKPFYVLKVDTNTITVINYENSTVETLLPERHMFMGNAYFYGKIVSMFGNGEDLACGNGTQNIMKYMMISQMCKNMGGGDMNPMAMMMFMNSDVMGNMFNNVFSAMGPSPTETKTDIDEG